MSRRARGRLILICLLIRDRFRVERRRRTCLRVMAAWRNVVEEGRRHRDLDRRRQALMLRRCFRGWRVLRARSTLTPKVRVCMRTWEWGSGGGVLKIERTVVLDLLTSHPGKCRTEAMLLFCAGRDSDLRGSTTPVAVQYRCLSLVWRCDEVGPVCCGNERYCVS